MSVFVVAYRNSNAIYFTLSKRAFLNPISAYYTHLIKLALNNRIDLQSNPALPLPPPISHLRASVYKCHRPFAKLSLNNWITPQSNPALSPSAPTSSYLKASPIIGFYSTSHFLITTKHLSIYAQYCNSSFVLPEFAVVRIT